MVIVCELDNNLIKTLVGDVLNLPPALWEDENRFRETFWQLLRTQEWAAQVDEWEAYIRRIENSLRARNEVEAR